MLWMLVAISISTVGELETWSVGEFTDQVDCEIYRSELAYTKTIDGSFPVNEQAICVEYIPDEYSTRWHQDVLEIPIPKIRG